MKFAVGYQLFLNDDFIENIIERKDSISEVYFSWGDFPNGRNNQLIHSEMAPIEATKKQDYDLAKLATNNIPLNMLFNATCYGKDSQSRAFFQKIGDTVDYIEKNYILKTITTTSPLIAEFIKSNFNSLDVRASVNLGIGSIEGMEYVAEYFDSFYLKREYNRDFIKIREMKNWCDNNGKQLFALANSGCLNNCSAHTFHDNLVSHESEISAMDNGFSFNGICSKFLKNKNNLEHLLDYTGFIRPEDIYLYENFFTSLKLATRINQNPLRILKAYIDEHSFNGNILELLEPNHSAAVYPYILSNKLIETDMDEKRVRYTNINKALIKLEEF